MDALTFHTPCMAGRDPLGPLPPFCELFSVLSCYYSNNNIPKIIDSIGCKYIPSVHILKYLSNASDYIIFGHTEKSTPFRN